MAAVGQGRAPGIAAGEAAGLGTPPDLRYDQWELCHVAVVKLRELRDDAFVGFGRHAARVPV